MAKKKLIPVGDNVIVIPVEDSLTTASGIIIPDTITKEKPKKGTVVAVGTGKLLDNGNMQPIPVKVGDVIVFTQYAPTEIKVNNQEYYIVGAHSILAIEK